MIRKIFAHLFGMIAGVIGFFGITHSLITLGSFIIGLCCGVAAGPMFGIGLGVGAATALIHTCVSMIMNNFRLRSRCSAINNNIQNLQDVNSTLTPRAQLSLDNQARELRKELKDEENYPLINELTPLAQALVFGMSAAKDIDDKTYSDETLYRAQKFGNYCM
jgi:hypothetical protein